MRTMPNSYVSPRQGGCLEYNYQEPRRPGDHAPFLETHGNSVRLAGLPKCLLMSFCKMSSSGFLLFSPVPAGGSVCVACPRSFSSDHS